MRIIKIPVLLAGLLGMFLCKNKWFIFFRWIKKRKWKKVMGRGRPTPTITIVKKWDMPKELTEISGLSYI
jgi:hypothetical protein